MSISSVARADTAVERDLEPVHRVEAGARPSPALAAARRQRDARSAGRRSGSRAQSVAYLIGGGLLFALVAEVSEHLATQAADIAPFWPPAGIGLALAIVCGPRILPVIAAAAFAGNFIELEAGAGVTFPVVTASLLATAVVDGGLAAFGAMLSWLPLRLSGATPEPFRSVRHAVTFIGLSAFAAPVVTAALGTTLLAVSGQMPWADAPHVWLTWAAGDAVGILVVAPLVLAWAPPLDLTWRWRPVAEQLCVLGVLGLIAVPITLDLPVEYLALLPLVWASFRLGLRGAAVTVVFVALGANLLDVGEHGYFARFEPEISLLLVQTFVGSVAAVPLVIIPAVAERRAEAEHRARLQQGLLIAKSIQEGLLPSEAPACPGFDIAGWSRPADETGGDFYDWVAVGDRGLVATLGDVTGHGIGPALVAAACSAYVRATVPAAVDPGVLLTKVNALLARDLPSDRLVTLAAVAIDGDRDEVLLRSAGQGPVCIYRQASASVETRPADSFPLGVIDDHEFGPAVPIVLLEGDMLVLLTDGFIEWASATGEMFGVERLRLSLAAAAGCSAKDVIAAIAEDVSRHAGGTPQADDLTMVVIRRAAVATTSV